MHFTLDELKYLQNVLSVGGSYTIARGEQIEHPSVKHKEIQEKIHNEIIRLTRWLNLLHEMILGTLHVQVLVIMTDIVIV